MPDLDALIDHRAVRAVLICSPTFAHAEQTVHAARAGKHVFCEKPIAMTLEEAEAMIARCHAAGVILMVGHVLRFKPPYVAVKERWSSLGRPIGVASWRLSGLARESWEGWLLSRGFGAVKAVIHDLDFLNWLLGSPRSVTTRGRRVPGGVWGHVMALLDYEEGLWARAEASLMVPPGFPFTMHFEALCDGGAVDFVFTGASYAESERQQLTIYRGNRPEEVTLPRTDAYQAEIDEFLACISEGRAPVSGTAAEARQALVLALAVKESLETGITVDLRK